MSVAVKNSPLFNDRKALKPSKPTWIDAGDDRKRKTPLKVNGDLPNGYHKSPSDGHRLKKARKSINGYTGSDGLSTLTPLKQLPLQEQRSKLPIAKGASFAIRSTAMLIMRRQRCTDTGISRKRGDCIAG